MGIPIVKTTYYFTNEMTQLIAASPTETLLAQGQIGLGTGVVTPGPTTTFTAVTEAAFTGYARSATIVWGLPINELDGSVSSLSPSHLFRCTAGGTPENIANFFVTDGVATPSTGILGVGMISPTIPIVTTGDGFTVLVSWNTGSTPGNCEGTILM